MRAVLSEAIGYPTGYAIYEDGRVYSFISEKWLSVSVANHGYPVVGMKVDEKRKRPVLLHRLLAVAFIPNPLGLPQINHLDGVKTNFRLTNLEWCSDARNRRHAWDTGLNQVTQKMRDAGRRMAPKLQAVTRAFSDQQADQIRCLRSGGVGVRKIARQFGCSHTTISRLCRNASYIQALKEIV